MCVCVRNAGSSRKRDSKKASTFYCSCKQEHPEAGSSRLCRVLVQMEGLLLEFTRVVDASFRCDLVNAGDFVSPTVCGVA